MAFEIKKLALLALLAMFLFLAMTRGPFQASELADPSQKAQNSPGTIPVIHQEQVIVDIAGVGYLRNPEALETANQDDVDKVSFITGIEPNVYCKTEERTCLGLDGGKWMCHPRVLLTQPREQCVVYSFGSKAEFSFELEVLRIAPDCEIHVFDPTPGLTEVVSQMTLPRGIHFHGDYGLATPGVNSISIKGTEVQVKSLPDIMQELGHESLHYLKIDIEKGELSPGFVDTSAGSVWRKVVQLQLEVHPKVGPERRATARLLHELHTVGFDLYHVEPNFIYPNMAEFAFVNRELMAPYVKIPYTPTQLEETKIESQRRLEGDTSYGNHPALNAFARVEKTHFGCDMLRRIPGQRQHTFCESFLDSQPIIYVFEESLTPEKEKWLRDFATRYQAEVHVWAQSTSSPSSSKRGELRIYPLQSAGNLDDLLSQGILDLMNQYGHTQVAMVLVNLPSLLPAPSLVSSLVKTPGTTKSSHFLAHSKNFSSPMQLILVISGCSRVPEEIRAFRDVVESLPTQGFPLLGKYMMAASSKEKVCEFTLTFASEK